MRVSWPCSARKAIRSTTRIEVVMVLTSGWALDDLLVGQAPVQNEGEFSPAAQFTSASGVTDPGANAEQFPEQLSRAEGEPPGAPDHRVQPPSDRRDFPIPPSPERCGSFLSFRKRFLGVPAGNARLDMLRFGDREHGFVLGRGGCVAALIEGGEKLLRCHPWLRL